MNELRFGELHGHSEMSNFRLIDCINKVDAYVNHAFEMGLNGVALTDHEVLSGHIKAIQTYKEIKEKNPDADFRLVLGNEIYLVDRAKENPDDKIKYYHFILLAKNKKGHEILRKLSSKAWENSYYDRRLERVPTLKKWVEEVKDEIQGNLYASTACLGSEFAQLVLKFLETNDENDKLKIHNFINWCINVFNKEHFFIEIQPSMSVEQIEYNKMAIKIAKAYGLSWIVTNDVHYLRKEDFNIHEKYLKSKEEERETVDFYSSTHFRSIKEIRQDLSYLNQDDVSKAISNTSFILDNVEEYDLFHEVIVPERTLPTFQLSNLFHNYYDSYQYINKFANSEYEQDRYLLHIIEKGFCKFKQEFNQENLQRIDIELKQLWEISLVLKQRMSSYYNLVEFIVEIMWDDNLGNSLVGVARGSVTGYYICYLIEIIQINPIDYNLPYWRHLVSNRPELPDIDLDSQANRRPFIFDSIKQKFGYNNGLNIVTFKTEGTKSAFLTGCRGKGINNDIAQEMADMIPSERGFLWSVRDCVYGNEEKGRKPIKELVSKLENYDGLLEIILGIEGLISGRSSHASGFYIFKNGYLKQNALMKTPSGQLVTQFNMEDSDYMGGLKIDCLTIKALDKLRKSLDWLIEHNQISQQENLRATYEKYLHPQSLDFNNYLVWENINQAKVSDLFQFETLVGSQAIKLLQPQNVEELAKGNSAMRLMAEDNGIPPLEMLAHNKKNIKEWYTMAENYGLTEEEIATLEKYLSTSFMLAIEQEDIMELSMDKNIAGFDIIWSNKLRKAVAKKKFDVLEDVKRKFFEQGFELGTRKKFLKFVWDKCIMLQAGYSFSRNHTIPYSIMGLQEAWLYTMYHPVYWNTACLTINSESSEDEIFNSESKYKSTQYGKIAKAISNMSKRGIQVDLPDINKANFEFTPDPNENKIIFGLKGISHVGDDLAKNIIVNRPYNSLKDFYQKVSPTTVQFIYLIKSGAFDLIEESNLLNRSDIMKQGVYIIANEIIKNDLKESLNMQNFPKVIELDLLSKEDQIFIRYWKFHKYALKNKFRHEKIRNKLVYKLDKIAQPFFEQHFAPHLNKNFDYWYNENGIMFFYKSKFQSLYKNIEDLMKRKMNEVEFLENYNCTLKEKTFNTIFEKYCLGSISKWEMDSISYYYHEHELLNIQNEKYNISQFSNLSKTPEYTLQLHKKSGQQWKKYELDRIAGTVLDVDKIKHIVYLLTTDGVVNVKFYDGAFVHYNKTISKTTYDEKQNKEVKKRVEESWFKRGTKLIITGYRNEDYFKPKKYYDSIYKHTVAKIKEVKKDGSLTISTARIRLD